MTDIILWVVILYPLIGLCVFWPLVCFIDKQIPPFINTLQITFLWPVALFAIIILLWDKYESRGR